jgi:hypothetical protein
VIDLTESVAQFGDALAGAVERIADSLLGPPKFERAGQARPAPNQAPPCRNCKWFRHGYPTVCYRKDLGMEFSVTEAERILVELPRPAVTLPPRELWHYVKRADIVPQHLAHVDNAKPGILGLVRHRGRLRRVIIEGHHRAYNARRARRAFQLYQLTEEETRRTLK